jgi:hypothetical protein
VERFNRVMKDGLRTGLADGQEFITAVRHTLAAYRTTPQGTTGVTPAALMLSFPVRTPLTILPLSSSVQPETSDPVTTRVQFQQTQMSKQHDRRYRAKRPTIQAGDMVRIRIPNPRHKLAPVYSEPLVVNKAVGNTVWLANGQRWNVRRCLRHKSSLSTSLPVPTGVNSSNVVPVADAENSDSDIAGPVFEFSRKQQHPRRSQRVIRPRDFGPYVRY